MPLAGGANYVDALDRLLLAREIWFRLLFEQYLRMRFVSRRWRALYAEMVQTARAHYLLPFTNNVFRSVATGAYYRFLLPGHLRSEESGWCYVSGGEQKCFHGVVTYSAQTGGNRHGKRTREYRYGLLDGIGENFCNKCGRLESIYVFRRGRKLIHAWGDDNCGTHHEVYRIYFDDGHNASRGAVYLNEYLLLGNAIRGLVRERHLEGVTRREWLSFARDVIKIRSQLRLGKHR